MATSWLGLRVVFKLLMQIKDDVKRMRESHGCRDGGAATRQASLPRRAVTRA